MRNLCSDERLVAVVRVLCRCPSCVVESELKDVVESMRRVVVLGAADLFSGARRLASYWSWGMIMVDTV